jgi:peptidoglycan hydrolase CwlO-like protein
MADDNLDRQVSTKSWITRLASNKATYFLLGGSMAAVGIALSGIGAVAGVGVEFAGACLLGIGTLGPLVYSTLKMRDTTNGTQELARELDNINRNQPSNGHTSYPTYINYCAQGLASGCVALGTVATLIADGLAKFDPEAFDSDDADATNKAILGLGISGSSIVAIGIIFGLVSHVGLAAYVAGRRDNLNEEIKKALRENAQQSHILPPPIDDSASLQELQAELGAVRRENNSLSRQLQKGGQVVDELNEKIDEAQKKIKKLEKRIVANHNTINTQKSTIEEQQEELASNKSTYQILMKDFNVQIKNNKQLESKLKETTKELYEMEQSKESIVELLAEKENKLEQRKIQVEALQNQIEKLEKEQQEKPSEQQSCISSNLS